MKTVSSNEMKLIEKESMDKNGIRSIVLMENAARGIVESCFSKLKTAKSIIIFCGSGNNGGDGFAAARLISLINKNVKIIFVGNYEKMTPDCMENEKIARKMGIEIADYNDGDILESELKASDIVIDAIIGTGLKNTLRPNYINLISQINQYSRYIISVDCPTGINSDNGAVNGVAVNADETITFYLPKTGLYLYPARAYCGKITTTQIGIIHENDNNIKTNILTGSEAKLLMPQRNNNSHKGTFGCVSAFTGCREMAGACCFSVKSAYKAGCGLVKAYVVNDLLPILQTAVPEAVTQKAADKNGFFCKETVVNDLDSGVILCGCGIGNNNDTFEFMKELIKHSSATIVLDADALNNISRDTSILKAIKGNCVITPHIKEMSRLTNLSTQEILNSPIETAVGFAQEYNLTVVLKSASTVIASPYGEVYINTTGNNSMAKGGSGDCLAGTAAGLIAQGADTFTASVLGSYINGKAAEIASKSLSDYSVMASDIINFIPEAIKEITCT